MILIIYHVNFSTYESVFLKRQTVPKGTTAPAETVLAQLTKAPGDDRLRDGGAEKSKKIETEPQALKSV